jgi:hypothetical protein
MRQIRSLEERFWPKVKIGKANECWEWQAAKYSNGYGTIGAPRGARQLLAHRVSYELTHDVSLPKSILVLHKCDNPPCVNPKHLRLGTPKDNSQDALKKGRFPTGDRHSSRLHPERVPRGDRHWARRRPELLQRGDSHWTHQHPERRTRGEQIGNAKLTESVVQAIRNQHARGELTQAQLARKYHVSPAQLHRVIHKICWGHVA